MSYIRSKTEASAMTHILGAFRTKGGDSHGRLYEKLHMEDDIQDFKQASVNATNIEKHEVDEPVESLNSNKPSKHLQQWSRASLIVLPWLILVTVLAYLYHRQVRLEPACSAAPSQQIIPTYPSSSPSSTTTLSPCGNTSTEAIARGCHMESMFYAWVPPACYYEDLSAQYLPFTDRRWYTAQTQSEEYRVDATELEVGAHRLVWATNYHKSHCLFLWRKLALAVEQRRPSIDSRTANREHSDHCAQILDEMPEDPGQLTRVRLSFYGCEDLPWGSSVDITG